MREPVSGWALCKFSLVPALPLALYLLPLLRGVPRLQT